MIKDYEKGLKLCLNKENLDFKIKNCIYVPTYNSIIIPIGDVKRCKNHGNQRKRRNCTIPLQSVCFKITHNAL